MAELIARYGKGKSHLVEKRIEPCFGVKRRFYAAVCNAHGARWPIVGLLTLAQYVECKRCQKILAKEAK